MSKKIKEDKVVQAIKDFKDGKLSESEMGEKLGIDNIHIILTQWELI